MHKVYDAPRTPYQRLVESGALSGTAQAQREQQLLAINPAQLQREIERALRALWACIERNERRKVG